MLTDKMYIPSCHPFRSEDCLEYPYEPTNEQLEDYLDPYERKPEWILASLAQFGNRIRIPQSTVPPRLRALCPIITSFCKDTMDPIHLYQLFDFFRPLHVKGRSLIVHTELLSMDPSELSGTLSLYETFEQIVIMHHLDQDRWALFLVQVQSRTYEGFMIGDFPVDEMARLQNKLGGAFGDALGAKFMYRQRVRIPQTFQVNAVLMAFLLAHDLHTHERYLDLTPATIAARKCIIMQPFIQLHDRWLGKLDLSVINKTTHYFISKKRKTDKLEDLETMGWTIIDVLGDGNCGFYSLILGLENNEDFSFSPSDDPSREMWQSKVVEFRQRLRLQSQLLLQTDYARGNRNQAFWQFSDVWGASDDNIDALSNSLVDDKLDDHGYFNNAFRLNVDHHLDVNWVPHVFSFTFGMRVVVYNRERQKDGTFIWMTLDFDYTRSPDDRVVFFQSLQRMTDEEFKSKPTVELLFLSGVRVSQHVIFLRRTICHGVERYTLASTSLRECIQKGNGSSNQVSTLSRPKVPLQLSVTNQAAKLKSQKVPLKYSASKKNVEKIPFKTQATKSRGKVLPPTIPERHKVLPSTGHGQTFAIKAATRRKGSKQFIRETKETRKKLTSLFEEQDETETTGKKLAVKLIYKPATKEFYKCDWDDKALKYKSKSEVVDNLEEFHEDLVTAAFTYPGTWMYPSLGAPRICKAPEHLTTSIATGYQQLEKSYCLTYSMASALLYLGFRYPAEWLADQACFFSSMDYTTSIAKFRSLMEICLPIIGQPTIYGKRTSRHNRLKRDLTWQQLLHDVTPYPTVVIPILPNGNATHAFCVVDDLIFDSITTFALKLNIDSVRWIFNDVDSRIFLALRFNKRCNPKGMKKKEEYTRKVKYNWDHPAKFGLSTAHTVEE